MFKTMKLPGIGEAGIAVLLIAIVSLMILPLPPPSSTGCSRSTS